MRDILKDITAWSEQGHPFALATVLFTWGSAPRGAGSAMAVGAADETGDVAVRGSVSGGCVENAVIEAAEEVLATGAPSILRFGVADETAWSVGLSCGGTIEVLVEPHISMRTEESEQAVWKSLQERLRAGKPYALLTRLTDAAHLVVEPDGTEEATVTGDWGESTETARKAALAAFARRRSEQIDIMGAPAFVHVVPPAPRLFVVGASHIALPLVKIALELEFEVTVIDPRGIFATLDRFGGAAPRALLHEWPDEAIPTLRPDEESYALTLTHDPKIDDAALKVLLRSPVRYIGALGSKKTHTKRCERLRSEGFTDEELAKIHAPVGLDIEAETPAEIALSIMAEIVAVRRGAQGALR